MINFPPIMLKLSNIYHNKWNDNHSFWRFRIIVNVFNATPLVDFR